MRAKNPRRMALMMLRSIKRNTNAMVSLWDQDQTVRDAAGWHKRTDAEKIENDPNEWDRLASFMDAVIFEAEAVREHALQQGLQAKHRKWRQDNER